MTLSVAYTIDSDHQCALVEFISPWAAEHRNRSELLLQRNDVLRSVAACTVILPHRSEGSERQIKRVGLILKRMKNLKKLIMKGNDYEEGDVYEGLAAAYILKNTRQITELDMTFKFYYLRRRFDVKPFADALRRHRSLEKVVLRFVKYGCGNFTADPTELQTALISLPHLRDLEVRQTDTRRQKVFFEDTFWCSLIKARLHHMRRLCYAVDVDVPFILASSLAVANSMSQLESLELSFASDVHGHLAHWLVHPECHVAKNASLQTLKLMGAFNAVAPVEEAAICTDKSGPGIGPEGALSRHPRTDQTSKHSKHVPDYCGSMSRKHALQLIAGLRDSQSLRTFELCGTPETSHSIGG